MKIAYKNGNTIIQNDDFNLAQTLDCGQSFRFSCNENGIWSGVVFDRLICLSQNENVITIYDMSEKEFIEKYYKYFTLDFDYSKLKEDLSSDEILKKAVKVAGGIRLLRQDKWETVCSFIFSQNNNIPRIKGIIDRFCKSFGEKKICEAGEYYTFPTVEKISALSVDDLAVIRAGFRAKYIVDAAAKISSGEVELDKLETMPIDEAREMLMKIKGVGPKVAECILLYSCSRFEAFPLDVWIKRVMAVLYPNGLPACALQYKGIAQQYLFHYARTIHLKDDE